MGAEKLKNEIFHLETQVEMLKALGVFHVKPIRQERNDGKGEWLVFKRRGAIIIDKSAPYTYRVSLPLERNKEKADKLLRKFERTKKAERLIKEINTLKGRLAEEERKARAAELERKAAEFKRQAAQSMKKASEYRAEANHFHQQAAYYTQQAVALQLA